MPTKLDLGTAGERFVELDILRTTGSWPTKDGTAPAWYTALEKETGKTGDAALIEAWSQVATEAFLTITEAILKSVLGSLEAPSKPAPKAGLDKLLDELFGPVPPAPGRRPSPSPAGRSVLPPEISELFKF